MGATEEEVVAPTDGILMTLREHPSVTEGSLVARVIGGECTYEKRNHIFLRKLLKRMSLR